jgi:hypothetical protein
MRISDILIKENNNSGQIILHKEGLFWRAYEQSAYLFSKHVRKYQVIRKHFKNVEKDIVFLGFPHSAKEDVLKSIISTDFQSDEKQVTIYGFQLDEAGFLEWKNSIELKAVTAPDNSLASESQVSYSVNKQDNPGNSILYMIQKFPVASKTPVECQQFIIEIQKQINGSL